jgi:hypothetical protein
VAFERQRLPAPRPEDPLVRSQDEPTIYREIGVESRKTVGDLTEAIGHAFGFYSRLAGQDVMHSQPKDDFFAHMREKTDAAA